MKKTNIIRFVEGLILLPAMTVSGSVGTNLPQATPSIVAHPQVVLSQKLNTKVVGTLDINPDPAPTTEELALQKVKAEAVDAYFKSKGMPLYGTGATMVAEAEKNGLDWRLLAAISVRESTGGKQECIKVPNNAFGWGSCKIGFKSNEEAIATVARNLGGNNPRTAHHYGEKTTYQILQAYNPPSIVPKYAEQVITIMNTIGPEDMSTTLASI